MCEKLKYCATKIDPCLVDEIKSLNELLFHPVVVMVNIMRQF
jgi:hypothetical protein